MEERILAEVSEKVHPKCFKSDCLFLGDSGGPMWSREEIDGEKLACLVGCRKIPALFASLAHYEKMDRFLPISVSSELRWSILLLISLLRHSIYLSPPEN